MANAFDQFDAPGASTSGNAFDQFDAAEAPKPKLTRSWGEAVTDTVKGVGAGFGSVLKAGGDLYGLASGDFDNFASREGRGMRKFYEDSQSEALQQNRAERSAAIDQADGILGKAGTAVKETVTDPALLIDFAASNAASMIPAGGVGRAAGALTKGRALLQGATQQAARRVAGRAATAAAVGTGAVQQGADVAGGVYDEGVAKDEAALAANPEYQQRVAAGEDPDAVRHELALSAARGAFPAATAISALSQAIPGGATLERALVGGAARATLRNPGLASRAYGVARGALGEGAQEAVEEGGGQFAGNVATRAYVDPNQDLSQDVGENAGMGFAGAIGLGGVAGATQTQRAPAEPAAKPGSLSEVAQQVAASTPQPVLALPAPTMLGRSDGRVATEAQAFAANQRRQERQVALASERESVGLTPDVNAARARHPGAVPNEGRRATLQPPQQAPAAPSRPKLDDGGFRRALAEQQARSGSLTDVASTTPPPALRPPPANMEEIDAQAHAWQNEQWDQMTDDDVANVVRGFLGKNASSTTPEQAARLTSFPVERIQKIWGKIQGQAPEPAETAPPSTVETAPPSNLDPETGELLGVDAPAWPAAPEHQQPQAIIAALTAEGMARKGRPLSVSRISETYNIDKPTARALRNQAVKAMTAASLPPVSEPDALAEPASSASAELAPPAAADAAPVVPAAPDQEPAARGEVASGEEAAASASPPAEVRAQDTPAQAESPVPDQPVAARATPADQDGNPSPQENSDGNEQTGRVVDVSGDASPLSGTEVSGLSTVRGEGNQDLSPVAGQEGVSDVPSGHGATATSVDEHRSDGHERELRTDELPLGDSATAGIEPTVLPSAGDQRQINDGAGGSQGTRLAADDVAETSAERSAAGKGTETGPARVSQGLEASDVPRADAKRAGVGKRARDKGANSARTTPTGDAAGTSTDAASALTAAANEAATSSTNSLPAPSKAQADSGNYKHGHARIAGLDISIENPRGSRRRPEWPPLAHHYGYLRGTVGNDKDHVDVFLTDNAADPDRPVFVVDQVNKDGSFDEHKVVLGAADEAEARKAYLDNYAKGWTGLGAITQMPMEDFKTWVMDPAKTRRPLGKIDDLRRSANPATPAAPTDRIEDFGEKIHGARKDYAASYGERIKDAITLDVARHPLSKTWPEPNYAKLLEEGANPRVVAFVHAARDQVPAKAASSWKLQRYVTAVTSLRETANKLLSGEIPADRMMHALDQDQSRAMADIVGRMELYEAVGHEHSLKGITVSVGQYSIYGGVKFDPPRVMWAVEGKPKSTGLSNWPRQLGTGSTKAEAIAAFKKSLATAREPAAKGPTRFDIYSRPRHAGFFIGKKIGRDHYDLEHFDDVKAARLYLAEHQAELEEKLAKIKDVPAHRRERNSPRVGIDHRGGADVSPEQFSEAFGFRGVQFGNYVEGPRRQRDLNQAYDSLMDLAGVLDVPARALSLNGSLGLAFGARGKGGKRAAAAHYEPTHVVINLTKGAGAGSLAHEWWHGLDNYFSRQRGRSLEYVSGSLAGKNEGLRPEMLRAFTRVMNTIHESGLKTRSLELDKRRSKAYWSTDLEMSARAFENYVIAKLADAGQSNDYLANIVSEASFGLSGEYPYLSAEEVPAVRAAYDDFFNTVEREETPDGNVRLFSKAAEDVVPVVAAQKSSEPAETMWRAADEFYRSNLQGKTFEGPDGPVRFSGASRKKALAQGRRDPIRLGVAQQLGEIARVAPVYEELEDRAGDRHLKYAYAVAPVDIDGERFAVKMVYRRSKGDAPGRSFYTFEGYEISEPGAMIRGRSPEGELGAQGSPGSGESVADLVAAINSASRRFALGAGTGGLAFDRALQLKAQITGKWGKNAPQVVLVENAEGFPDSAKVDPQYRRGEGFYNGKPTIWINVGNIRTEKRFAEVMAHEGLGHFGVERVVGRDQWAGIVDAVEKLERKGAVNTKIAAVLKDVRQRYGTVDRETYAKEVIAVLAERGIRNSWVDKVVAAVRRWLRANMPALGWGEKDVLGLLSQAESFLRAGTSQAESRQQVASLAFSLGQRARMRVDAAGRRSLEFGGETFVDRSGKFYLVNGDGKPKDFLTLGAAAEAAQRTGGNLLVNEPEEGAKPSWSVVAPDVAVRGAELPNGRTPGQGLFSMAPDDVSAAVDPAQSFEEITEQFTLPAERALDTAKGWVASKFADFKPVVLKAVQFPYLLELGTRWHQQMASYADKAARMAAYRNMLIDKAGTVAKAWQGWAYLGGVQGLWGLRAKQTQAARQLNRVIHDSTQLGVDPSQAYTPTMWRDSRGKLQPYDRDAVNKRIKAIKEQIRGRPGDNKTAFYDQLNELNGVHKREERRRAAYPKIVARYQALADGQKEMFFTRGDDGRIDALYGTRREAEEALSREQRRGEISTAPAPHAIFMGVRDFYENQRDAMEAALIERVQEMELFENETEPAGAKDITRVQRREHETAVRKAMEASIRLEFENSRLEGIYFPMNRDGDYWISAKSPDGEYAFVMQETNRGYQQSIKALKAKGYAIEGKGRRGGKAEAKDAIPGTFAGELMSTLKEARASEAVQDEVYQLLLKALPEMSVRKHGIHRKNVAGFNEDALRAFAKSGFHGAHELARVTYSYQMQKDMDAAKIANDNRRKSEDMEPNEAAAADAYLAEWKERHEWVMSPRDSSLANTLGSINFFMYLGLSPAAALVNMFQLPQVTLPVMAARHGMRAASALNRAMKDTIRTKGNLEKVAANPEEMDAIRALSESGHFQRTMTHALAGLSEGDSLRMNPGWAKTMAGVGWMFQKAEEVNRKVTGLAAFRVARAAGESFDEALRYAQKMIDGTHGDYSNAARPAWMRGLVGRTVFQFKTYGVFMATLLGDSFYKQFKGETKEVRREAMRTFWGIMGMTSLFAGVMGTPVYTLLAAVAGALAAATGDDDEPWDADVEFRKFLEQMLGQSGGQAVARGLPYLSGVDMSSRVGMEALLFRGADREMEGADAYHYLLETLAGPTGGLAKNVFRGLQMMGEGKVYRGVETMSPKFTRDAMRAGRYATEGATSMRGDPILDDLKSPEELLQVLGFTPSRLASQYDQNRALKNYERHVKERRAALMNALALATRTHNQDLRSDTMQSIRKFNRKYPEIAITSKSISASLRSRASYSQRAESGIVLDRRLARRVREEVGAE